jgi:hypothetical protein
MTARSRVTFSGGSVVISVALAARGVRVAEQTWTAKMVLDLAPDASSASSARSCSNPGKWVTIGRSETALWGEFQGSGSKPYQTQVDLREPAFKCSCPSRKFPCKHGLGIMLALAEKPAAIKTASAPQWVTDWLAGREAKAAKREEKAAAAAASAEAAPVDAEAQAKRVAAREAKVNAGLEELAAFLSDMVRQGLAAVQAKPQSFFEKPAARLVDAQASGLARLVRELSSLASSGEGWQSRLLAAIGRVHLLVQAYRNQEKLPPATAAEVRALVGWTQPQEQVLAQAGVKGRWIVVSQNAEREAQLTTQTTWLIERETARPAMVLHFAACAQPLDRTLVVGTEIEAELVDFPAGTPLRALVKSRNGVPATASVLPGSTVGESLDAYAAALSNSPWLESWPITLRNVVPVRRDDRQWLLRDEMGAALPVDRRFDKGWELMAISGGSGIHVMGEWDGTIFRPLAAVGAGEFVPLKWILAAEAEAVEEAA